MAEPARAMCSSRPSRRLRITRLPIRGPGKHDGPHRDVRLLRLERNGLQLFRLRIDGGGDLARLGVDLRIERRDLLIDGGDVLAGAGHVLTLLVNARGAARRRAGAADGADADRLAAEQRAQDRSADGDGGVPLARARLLLL